MKQLGQSAYGHQASNLFWGKDQKARKGPPPHRHHSPHAWTDTGIYLPSALFRAMAAHAPWNQQQDPRP